MAERELIHWIRLMSPPHRVPFFRLRGVPYVGDLNLQGDLRFAKRVGNDGSAIVADNRTAVTADAVDGIVTVNRIPPGYVEGARVVVGGTRIRTIEAIFSDESDVTNPVYTLTLEGSDLELTSSGTEIILDAYPITLVSSSGTDLTVLSGVPLYYGDSISVGYREILVLSATATGVTSGELTEYSLVLGEERTVGSSESLYVKAYPAYSHTVVVPSLRGDRSVTGQVVPPLGPFQMELPEGGWSNDSDVQVYSRAVLKDAIFTERETVTQWHRGYGVGGPIQAVDMSLWELPEGDYLQPYKPGRAEVKANTHGHAYMYYNLHPGYIRAVQATFRVTADATSTLLVQQGTTIDEFSLSVGDNILTLSAPTDVVDEISLRFAGSSGQVWVVGDWIPVENPVRWIEYSIVAQSTIPYDWAAVGIMYKPLLPQIALATAAVDHSRRLDTMILL